jgi:choice-of-anchor B domain-containing protein
MKTSGYHLFGFLSLFLLVVPAHAQSGYGQAVAVGDGDILVGESANRMSSGVVYVYRRDGSGRWTETAQVTASDATAGDRFGQAIAVDGQVMMVAAAPGGNGVVYVYETDGTGTWREVTRLQAEDGESRSFGAAIALSGGVALIGAPGRGAGGFGFGGGAPPADGPAGAVHVFQRYAGGTWSHQQTIAGEDVASADRFGAAVALDGNRALIGAPGQNRAAGAAYGFSREADGTWRQLAKVTANGLEQRNGFGGTVALQGNTAFVGAPGANGTIGTVFVFAYDGAGGEWRQASQLSPFDGVRRYQFGSSIAFTGSEVWVGAPGAAGGGRVYRFRRDPAGDWMGSIKLASRQTEGRDGFSGTLAVHGKIAVAGAPGDDFGAGTAIVFEQDAGGATWSEQAKIFSDVKGIDPVLGDQADCDEGNAHVFGCSDVDLVSFLPVHAIGGERGVRTNDVWGWTDAQTGKEYAIVGMSNAASFVDISDVFNPVYLGKLPLHEGARPSTWRDMKVYKDHAFIVSDGAGDHGMQVFDLTQLRDVRDGPVVFEETAHYDGIHSAHNIVINEATGYAYSVGSSAGGETCGGGLHMINIEDPRNPRFAGCFADPTTGRASTGYSHDAQCVIYEGPDREHQGKEICMGANETALSIADVTDKKNPVALSQATYPNVGYSHQGWFSEDQRYFYMNDELDELQRNFVGTRTLIWDVTDLDDPVLAKEYLSENTASDHNLYVRGDFMYQSNYNSGFRVFNIRDRENPVPVGFLDTVPYGEDGPGMGGSWSNYPFFESGVILVTSGNEGLFLVKRKSPEIL